MTISPISQTERLERLRQHHLSEAGEDQAPVKRRTKYFDKVPPLLRRRQKRAPYNTAPTPQAGQLKLGQSWKKQLPDAPKRGITFEGVAFTTVTSQEKSPNEANVGFVYQPQLNTQFSQPATQKIETFLQKQSLQLSPAPQDDKIRVFPKEVDLAAQFMSTFKTPSSAHKTEQTVKSLLGSFKNLLEKHEEGSLTDKDVKAFKAIKSTIKTAIKTGKLGKKDISAKDIKALNGARSLLHEKKLAKMGIKNADKLSEAFSILSQKHNQGQGLSVAEKKALRLIRKVIAETVKKGSFAGKGLSVHQEEKLEAIMKK